MGLILYLSRVRQKKQRNWRFQITAGIQKGVMARYFSYVVTNCSNINGYASNGTVKADKDGHLLKGWQYDSDTDTYTYYGKYYIQYRSSILEENGLLYYFNADGLLERGSEVVIDGILYGADENGVLTVRENPGKTGWIFVDEVWYYYQDGKLLTNTCATINGEEYYFGYSGQMLTGIIYDENLRNYRFAEASGKVVHATGWYYVKTNGEAAHSEVVHVNGKSY